MDFDILQLCNNYSEMSDAIRWNAVAEHGGIWIDSDFLCLKNIESLINDLSIFISTEDNRHLCGGFFGAVKGHPITKRLAGLVEPTLKATMDKPSDQRIGPKWVTKNISWDEITVLPKKYFYPYLPGQQRERDTFRNKGEAYAVHIWGGSWLKQPKQELVI